MAQAVQVQRQKLEEILIPGGRIYPLSGKLGVPIDPKEVMVEEGQAMALLPLEEYTNEAMVRGQNPRTLYSYEGFDPSRDFKTALENRVAKAVADGKVSIKDTPTELNPKGDFHDPLYRFDGIEIGENGKPVLRIVPALYHEHAATNGRAAKDSKWAAYLTEKGISDFGDPEAYFANVCGVSAVLVSKEKDGSKKVLFGERSEKGSFPLHNHNFAGFGDAGNKDNPLIYDTQKILDHLQSVARQELAEEQVKLKEGEISKVLLMGFSAGNRAGSKNPNYLNFDANFVLYSNLPAEELQKRGKLARDVADHRKVYALTLPELEVVLSDPNALFVPQGRAGLIQYLFLEDRQAGERLMQKYKEWESK